MRSRPSPSSPFVRSFLVATALVSSLGAQGLQVGAPGPAPHQGPGHGVSIRSTSVHTEIVDGVATTTIRQLLHNAGEREAEGTWLLPLPKGAVATGLKMLVGDKELAGEVLAADAARSIYEGIVRQRRDPGLLEFAGDGLLRARVYPIPARGDVGVEVRWQQVLQPTGGLYEWSWPLRAMRLGDVAGGTIGIVVDIRSQTPLATVVAPGGAGDVQRDGEHRATVSWEGAGRSAGADGDPRVLFGLRDQEFGVHLLSYRRPGEPGWFALLVAPPRRLHEAELPRRCVQLVVDTSGSMAGAKMQQAKLAVQTFLQHLRPDDLFQILPFSTSVTPFFPTPVLADEANLATARRRVGELEARGGTNIGEALQRAFAGVQATAEAAGRLQQIVFVTDGEPTVGETMPQRILAQAMDANRHAARLFALGVGNDVDVPLLDDLAEQHRGARDFVGEQERLELKVDALCQKLAQPAMSDVEVRCEGVEVYEMHPTRVRDLFCGDQMYVVGRYRGDGEHQVVVTGVQNGEPREFRFPVVFPLVSERHTFVQTTWARQHVGALLAEIRRGGSSQELLDEVRSIATRYGVVTPYTSQLVLEEQDRLRGVPPAPGGGAGRFPAGPTTGGPSGPTTGGPGGPSAPMPSGPTTGGPPPRNGSGSRTGEQAVRDSRATNDVGLRAEAGGDGVLRADGRTFLRVGAEIVEQGLPGDWEKQAESLVAYSDEYFALLRHKPGLRDVMALGECVVFRDGVRIVRVRSAAAVATKPAGAPK